MKEIGFTLHGFSFGLRRYEDDVINKDEALECFNLVPRLQGAVQPQDISQPITATEASLDYPFPQFFFGYNHWFCCTKDKIYKIQADWSLTLLLDLSQDFAANPTWEYQPWHFADFFSYALFTNGYVVVSSDPTTGLLSVRSPDSTMPTLGTLLNFNGQLIASPTSTWEDTDSNSLIWSKIGSADFSLDKSNISGYRPMPWFGEIYNIKQLGQFIGVYGSGGIGYFKFVGNSLGLVKTLNYGIAGRNAVESDISTNLFIDSACNLRIINENLEISDGLFQEFFSPMLTNDIMISCDALNGDFYITDGTKCYVKTPQGLGEVGEGPTSLGIVGGALVGKCVDFGDSTSHYTSTTQDFGVRARKTLDLIEVGGSGVEDLKVAVDWRMNSAEDFQSTDYVSVNREGTAVLPISGVEFRFKVLAGTKEDLKLNYILPRLKFDDKRSRRGINVSAATS